MEKHACLLILEAVDFSMMSSSHSDDDSDLLDSESQNATIKSLETELSKITQQLQNFSPEQKKNRVGRPPKQKTTTQKSDPIHNICALVGKIITQLDGVLTENRDLRTRVERIEEREGTADSVETAEKSYAATLAGKRMPPQDSIHQFDTRIDQIEQESLSTTLKFDGDLIKTKIDDYNIEIEKDRPKFNRTVIQAVNKVQPGLLKEQDIDSINIVGKEKKHLKVKLNHCDKKINLLKTFKHLKPNNFYISQYLTRKRSFSLYKLKTLQKNNQTIERVYSYNGTICCKLNNTTKIFYLNNPESVDNFTSEHKLNE